MCMKIKIMHLYPDLLNLYGDKGNIECLKHRLAWRGIDAEVIEVLGDDNVNISDADIIFLGGGSDKEQKIVCEKLMPYKHELKNYVENGGTMLAVCGGYELLGKSCVLGGETVKALEILDIYAEAGADRLTDNVILQSDILDCKVVGFENHANRMNIGSYEPLGKVLCGNGNDGKSGYEGVVYKNLVGTYLYGPLLPKNPKLCDYILAKALPDYDKLPELDDTIENNANEAIVKRFVK